MQISYPPEKPIHFLRISCVCKISIISRNRISPFPPKVRMVENVSNPFLDLCACRTQSHCFIEIAKCQSHNPVIVRRIRILIQPLGIKPGVVTLHNILSRAKGIGIKIIQKLVKCLRGVPGISAYDPIQSSFGSPVIRTFHFQNICFYIYCFFKRF